MNWYRSILSYVLVALAAVAAVEGGLALIGAGTWKPLDWTRLLGIALLAMLLGLLASRSTTRRMQRMRDVSQAWLRGNLALRIADPGTDSLGQLAGQLDLLANHLAQDEKDVQELRERYTRLADQLSALAVSEERRRLARELHDGVKQHLFSLAMTASAIRTHMDKTQDLAGLADMVREVETTAQTAQREMTHLIENLRPASLQEQGLAKALNNHTLLFGAQEHLLIYLDAQGNDALLPPQIAEALYRVAQEALHNAARHARATRVDVHLRCLPEQAWLTVRDDGAGFDTTQARKGLGLANMQERLMAIGGRLSIESRPGAGTQVLAEVGLDRPLGSQPSVARLDEHCPRPSIDNWPWLGQRLVIPVGQTWPWHPADQRYLRQPLVEPGDEPVMVSQGSALLGLRREWVLHLPGQAPLRVRRGRSGYEWQATQTTWALEHFQSPDDVQRAVLMRKGQALAALQTQGRRVDSWTEIVYDGHGYRLAPIKDLPGQFILFDEAGDELLLAEGSNSMQVALRRALPLPLLMVALARLIDERRVSVDMAHHIKE
jgi:NarL family two-component system sensor histidine kinase LiaS